ncbi:CapA family protein [Bacillus mesophilum]|nr:CapA family protein [Bacillus mesophilum]
MYKGIIFIGITLGVLSAIIFYNMYECDEAKNKNFRSVSLHSTDKEIDLDLKMIERRTTIAGIGDILIHDRVYELAQTASGYDFTPMLQKVKPMLQAPDLLIANQETILGGEEIGISSYPSFNSPQQVGDAIVEAGIDLVSTANNHSLDKNEKGLLASLSYMDKIGLSHTGTSRSQAESEKVTTLESNGIRFAFLSYTYGTNGIPIPDGKEFLVNLINRKQMKKDIQKAKQSADVIIMSVHWGNEYERFPTVEQKELGSYLIESGADLIFGHHPHVLQPMEWHTTEDGRKGLIVYSLGNFLSGQIDDYKDLGGMTAVDVKMTMQDGSKKISLMNPQFYPTYVSKEPSQMYHVVPLLEAGQFGLRNYKAVYKEMMAHMMSSLQ